MFQNHQMNATDLSSACPGIDFSVPHKSYLTSFSIGDYILKNLQKTFEIIQSSSTIENNTIVEFVRADIQDTDLPLSENDLLVYLKCSVKYANHFLRAESPFFAVSFKPQEYKNLGMRDMVPFVVDSKTKFRAGGFGMVEKVFEGTKAFARKTFSDNYDQSKIMMEIKLLEAATETGNPHVAHLRCAYEQGDPTCVVIYPWCEFDLSYFLSSAHKMPQWTKHTAKQKAGILTNWMACLASGLSALHKKKIGHHDIKPENVMLDENFMPVISDFGLSKAFDRNSKSVKFQETLAYFSPERLNGDVGKKGDIFSLGLIFMELGLFLYGEKGLKDEFIDGFYSEITKNLDNFMAKKFPMMMSSCIDDWNKRFQSLVQSMLHVTPENRPKASKVFEKVKEMVLLLGAKPHCDDELNPPEHDAWEEEEEFNYRVNCAIGVV